MHLHLSTIQKKKLKTKPKPSKPNTGNWNIMEIGIYWKLGTFHCSI